MESEKVPRYLIVLLTRDSRSILCVQIGIDLVKQIERRWVTLLNGEN